jgi:hypothetical protein
MQVFGLPRHELVALSAQPGTGLSTPELRVKQYEHREKLQATEEHPEREHPLSGIRQRGKIASRTNDGAQSRPDICDSGERPTEAGEEIEVQGHQG